MKLAVGLGILTICTPIGMLAKGTAWGEWASTELSARLGFVPDGMRRLESLWQGKMSGYAMPGWESSGKAFLGYLISAVVGLALVALISLVIGKILTAGRKDASS